MTKWQGMTNAEHLANCERLEAARKQRQWRAVVRNEDVTPIYTVAKATQQEAFELARTWLMGFTDEQRREVGTKDSDEGWYNTLCHNGFFSIALYEEL